MVEYKQNVSDQNNSNHGEGKRMADGVNYDDNLMPLLCMLIAVHKSFLHEKDRRHGQNRDKTV